MPQPDTIYLKRRRPCWLCSKSLHPATTGPNRGRYVGVRLAIDGEERIAHASCAGGYEQHTELVATDDAHASLVPIPEGGDGTFGWRKLRAPQDQEKED